MNSPEVNEGIANGLRARVDEPLGVRETCEGCGAPSWRRLSSRSTMNSKGLCASCATKPTRPVERPGTCWDCGRVDVPLVGTKQVCGWCAAVYR